MRYNIIFKTTNTSNEKTQLSFTFDPDKARLNPYQVAIDDLMNTLPNGWLLLFQPNGYQLCVEHIRTQIKSMALTYLMNNKTALIRKKNKENIAVQNYLDEISIVIPIPLPIHTHYRQQQEELLKRGYLGLTPSIDYHTTPPRNHHDKLSLTELQVLAEMKLHTETTNQFTYLTSADLGRRMELSPEMLRRTLNSSALQAFIDIKRITGCNIQTLEFTPEGKKTFLLPPKYPTSYQVESKKIQRQIVEQKQYPILNGYHFHTHVVLIKRLTDEHKKILNNASTTEIRKEAALALSLMGAT